MAEPADVLLVDDDPSARLAARSLLLPLGCKVREAVDGEAALVELAKAVPDVLLSDLMMPGMDGFALCRAVRAEARWRHVPIIVLTALGDRETSVAALDAGATEFLGKPVFGPELRARVRSMLRIKAQHDEIQALLESRTRFSRMLVHDMRSPLMALSTGIDLLHDGARAEDVEILTDLREASARLSGMVDELLVLSRLEHGSLPLDVEELSLAAVVAQAIATTQSQFASRGVPLEAPPTEGDLRVRGDRKLLLRVVENLLVNAAKFSLERRLVRVSCEVRGADAVVTVRDEGVGVPPDFVPQLFQPYAVSRVQGRGVTQTGLGLAFCALVAGAHGGRVDYAPNTPCGAAFSLVLPALAAEAPGV